MYTHSPALPTYFLTHGFNQLVIALHCTQCHRIRKTICAVEPHGQSPFKIFSNKKRNLANGLQLIGNAGLYRRRACKKNDATYLIILYPHFQLFNIVWFARHIAPGHKQLAYLFFQGQRCQDRICPSVVFITVKPNVRLGLKCTSH